MISRRAIFGVVAGACIGPIPQRSIAAMCRDAGAVAEAYLFHRNQAELIVDLARSFAGHLDRFNIDA